MPHPYVTHVTFADGQIILTIELAKSMANESVEISGYATQNSGGFATFYDIQSPGENPDGTVIMYVSATPTKAFQNGEDVTASLRASRVWVTVLKESRDGQTSPRYDPESVGMQGPGAKDGTSWSNIRAVGWASPSPVSTAGDPQASVGNDSPFQGI
jgi:hypothetical protein